MDIASTHSPDPETTRLWARVEDRDPANAIHVGRRMYVQGNVAPPPPLAPSSKRVASMSQAGEDA